MNKLFFFTLYALLSVQLCTKYDQYYNPNTIHVMEEKPCESFLNIKPPQEVQKNYKNNINPNLIKPKEIDID